MKEILYGRLSSTLDLTWNAPFGYPKDNNEEGWTTQARGHLYDMPIFESSRGWRVCIPRHRWASEQTHGLLRPAIAASESSTPLKLGVPAFSCRLGIKKPLRRVNYRSLID
jgi:hypothetical protein